MLSKVILFGVLIFYSNFVVSVPYPEELIQERVYWPSNWSGNEHAHRQFRNDGFAQTHNENHVKPSIRRSANNQEHNNNQVRSSNSNVYNNNPPVLPVPDKQLLPHYVSPVFKREFNPNLQRPSQELPHRHNVDRSEIKTINQQFRHQKRNPQIQHPSSSYTNEHERPSYIPSSVTNYRREHNANPISLQYHNQATENVENKGHILRQKPFLRPNSPISNINLGGSNDHVPKLEDSIASVSNNANNKNPLASEATEALSNTVRERKQHNHAPRKNKPYLIANHLVQKNENNNFSGHATEASKLILPDVLVNEPRNRIYRDNNEARLKKIEPERVSSASEANVAANNHENRRFIKIDRLDSQYRIPVIPLNTYNNGPAKINDVETRNQQDTFVVDGIATNYRESSPINNAALINDAVVNHPKHNLPVNIPKEKRFYRPKPIGTHHNSPEVASSNLANTHQNILHVQNNNYQVGSGVRRLIPGDGYNNEQQVIRKNLKNTDNIYNTAAKEKHVTERKPENSKDNNNENLSHAYRDLTTINTYNNFPALSPDVAEKPNNERYTETDKLSFADRGTKPEQNYNPVTENVRAIEHKNIRHIGNARESFRKRNFKAINAPGSFGNDNDYGPQNTRPINKFRPRLENRDYEPVNTYDNAPSVVNHNEANNHESNIYIDNDREDSNPTTLDNIPVRINNVEENKKAYRPENHIHIKNYNDAVVNLDHIPSNTYNHSPAAVQTHSHNSRFIHDNVAPSNIAPAVLVNDEAYNPENRPYIDDNRRGLDFRDPLPVYNHDNAPTVLEYVENNPEDIKYLDNERSVLGPFKTYNDALQVLSKLGTNKHEKQTFADNYEPISPNRELNTNDNTPLPTHETAEEIVNHKYNTDISPNYKSDDQAIFNINNGAQNVPRDTVNYNAGNPNPENQNRPQPGLLEPAPANISNSNLIVPHQLPTQKQNLKNVSPNKDHFVLVQPDGSLEDLNSVGNAEINENDKKDIVNNNDRQDKVVAETFTTQSPDNVPISLTANTPVPTHTYINENINKDVANKDNQQEPPVEEIYKTQSQAVDIAAPNLIAASPPVPEKNNVLPTNNNLAVNNNGLNAILPVTKESEYNSSPLKLPETIPESLPIDSIVNEPDENKELLPTLNDFTTVVTTPYPYVTDASPIELITDNVYDQLATTTVSPITESTTVLENYNNSKQKDVKNDNTYNTSSVDTSQYTVAVAEITSELHRNDTKGDVSEGIVTNYNVTRSDDNTVSTQIINQQNKTQTVPYNSPPDADILTRSDGPIIDNRGDISAIPDRNLLESKPSPYGIKLVLDPNSVSEDDTITIAIELSEAPDVPGLTKGGIQVFNVSPRNNYADGYSNDFLNSWEDCPTVNGDPTVLLRTANDHINRNYENDIEPYPIYLIPIEPQPVKEKETHITQYPNGTIVTVITEIVYDNQEGTPPKITTTKEIAEPKHQ